MADSDSARFDIDREKTVIQFSHDRIESLVVGRQFAMPATQDYLMQNFKCSRYRDVMHVPLNDGECWLFDYGVMVFWGVSEDEKQGFLLKLDDFIEQSLEKPEFEQFRFVLGADNLSISGDSLRLEGQAEISRLAASHAFAQSAKLSGFEGKVIKVIEDNAYIPSGLAKTGRVPLNRKQLAMLRGELFSTRSDIVLNFNLLDTPEFFWEHPELEGIYNQVGRYLDLTPRVTLLNKKLDTVYELLQMLADEQNHKHSAWLEWIIIILIAVDILIYFL